MADPSKLVQPQMVCPHCWHNFYADGAYFISRHAELKGDSVLGPFENRRFAPHEVKHERDGSKRDSKGWEMLERACPMCHLQIPPELLNRKPFFVSVVGAPRAGKTYFLASMIHWLRKELAKEFGYSFNDSDSHEVRAFQEYEKTLFFSANPSEPTYLSKTEEHGSLYNLVRLDGVEVQLPKPFIFSLRPTEANPDASKSGTTLHGSVVLYDNAGESFEPLKEKEGNVRVTQHLAESDAVLFTFDPLQDPSARMKLQAASQDPQLGRAAISNRQETILSEVINRMRRYSDRPEHKKLRPLLGVCVQKYDVWKSLLPHVRSESLDGDRQWSIDHTSVEFSSRHGIAGLDIEEINRISLLVRSFINDINPQFVALAESNFKVVRYFPVSALGVSPEVDPVDAQSSLLKVRPINLQPFRVTHPMLWLLQRWKFIRTARKATDDSQKYPHMILREVVDGKMRLSSPSSGRVLNLDLEYAGSTIIDPSSGEIVWVPPIEKSNDNSDPTKRESSTDAAGSHAKQVTNPPPLPTSSPQRVEDPAAFKLGQTAPRPKKGWFRK